MDLANDKNIKYVYFCRFYYSKFSQIFGYRSICQEAMETVHRTLFKKIVLKAHQREDLGNHQGRLSESDMLYQIYC